MNPNVENKIKVTYHGMDSKYFNNKPLSKEELEYFYFFNLKNTYILFVSYIYEYKNVHTLVEAFGKINSKLKYPADLVLIGEYIKILNLISI